LKFPIIAEAILCGYPRVIWLKNPHHPPFSDSDGPIIFVFADVSIVPSNHDNSPVPIFVNYLVTYRVGCRGVPPSVGLSICPTLLPFESTINDLPLFVGLSIWPTVLPFESEINDLPPFVGVSMCPTVLPFESEINDLLFCADATVVINANPIANTIAFFILTPRTIAKCRLSLFPANSKHFLNL
jgi:hypothetical protein